MVGEEAFFLVAEEEAELLMADPDATAPVRPLEAYFCITLAAVPLPMLAASSSSSSIGPSEDRSIVCFDADEAEDRRALPAGKAEAAGKATPLSLMLFSLVLLDPAWLVEGVRGVAGAFALFVVLVCDCDDDGRGVFDAAGGGAFLKNPSRLDCFPTGLLMVR